jgi:hypothetical protein
MLECTLSSPAGVFMVAVSAWPAGGDVAGMLDGAGDGAGGVGGTGGG